MAFRLQIGDDYKAVATFIDSEGVPIDPTVVTIQIKAPSSSAVEYTYPAVIERLAEGVYRCIIDCTEAGFWYFKWESEGTGKGAANGRFFVEADNF